ncbi:MAG: T9SS type A sorting domain-containing protein [Chitinophagaceae bacterium]|nr:T9SS type A sorting domain-containing protein [Chitinophagaceae bacterium]
MRRIKYFFWITVLTLMYGVGIAQVSCVNYYGGFYTPWNSAAWDFPNMKQKKVTYYTPTPIDATNGFFYGLLEYKPASYNLPENSGKKYPVIIYFHGGASKGFGGPTELCRLFKDNGLDDLATHLSIPGRVERSTGLFTQTVGGETYEYLVISPQFSRYNRNDSPNPPNPTAALDFPSAQEVENVINYVEANYRIDPDRIYLTGYSNGANMIVEYAASSVARAQRIAAMVPISFCSDISSPRNTQRGYIPQNIGAAGLPTWWIQCNIDNPCGLRPREWVDAIKNTPGNATPRFTILNDANPNPLYQCSDTLLHDAWSRAYDPNFRASFTNGNGENDGINMNIYEWLLDPVYITLPVAMKSYTARLVDDRVELKWVTTMEQDNASFVIERAGADQQYTTIGQMPGAVNHSGEKSYTFTDNNPLPDLSFYRLVQVDIDGKKTYFDIKKILNQKGNSASVIVSPNPIVGDASAFISISRSQKIAMTLTDMNGKIIQQVNGIYGQGSSEVKLRASGLSKGVYLLKVSGEDFNVTKKIIKR